MTAQTFTDWIPEEWGGPVIAKIAALSAVEAVARTEAMGTDTKHVPRSAGMAFGGAIVKSAAYGEATGTNDEVLLKALKFGTVVRIADEDIKDTAGLVNVISTKQQEWARGHAIGWDNACLGVSAAADATDGQPPYNSLYYSLNTTNADTGYTGDANLTLTAGALTYSHLSATFEKVETSDFYDEGRMVVIAHPSFKARLREITGTQTFYNGTAEESGSDGRPVFVEHSSLQSGAPDTLFGVPVRWTLGAKVHATATSTPTGNPLLFVGNADYLVKGDRSGPEYMVAGADTGAAFLTDEALLKMRIRRAFAVANENAWACIEKTAA